MLIPFGNIYIKYKMNVRGILHIGAHHCEELGAYMQYGVPKNKIIWIEANPDLVNLIKNRDPDIIIKNYLITDKDQQNYEFKITNNGQSSSIFDFGTHSHFYPMITFIDTKKLTSSRIDTIYREENIPENFANFLNIDIQGAELLALKSMGNILSNFDYLYLEVNKDHVYKNCCLVEEIDNYVQKYNFKRVETKWNLNHGWGDALYIKTQPIFW